MSNPVFTWLADHVFDPIQAAISRAKTSSNPTAAAVGAAADSAYQKITTDVTSTVNAPITSQSAVALGNTAIADFEAGLQGVVDALVTATVGRVPVVGPALAPEAVAGANIALTFAEQHGLTFLSSLFNHAQAKVAAAVKPTLPAPPAPAATAAPGAQAGE